MKKNKTDIFGDLRKKFSYFDVLKSQSIIFFKTSPVKFIFLLLIRLIRSATPAILVVLTAWFISSLSATPIIVSEAVKYLSIMLVTTGGSLLLGIAERALQENLDHFVYVKLETSMAGKIQNIKYETLIQTNFQSLKQAATFGYYRGMECFSSLIYLISAVFTLGSIIGVLLSYSLWVALLLGCVSIPLIFFGIYRSKIRYEMDTSRIEIDKEQRAYSDMFSNTNAVPEIRSYNASSFFVQKCLKIKKRLLDKDVSKSYKDGGLELANELFQILSLFGVIALVIWQLWVGALTIAIFSALFTAIDSYFGTLTNISIEAAYMSESYEHFKNYMSFMALEDEESGTKKAVFNKEIVLKNVVFCYPKQDGKEEAQNIFDGLDFTLKKGERVAIVGENGCGKTTLIQLLLGLLKLKSGEFKIDDKNFDDLDIKSYRSLFTIVSQENFRYNLKIKEVVALSDSARIDNKEQIENAIEKATIGEKAQDIEQQIGRRLDGIELSGGEWQKMGIARSFFKTQAEIYVFDEPTSNLDAIVEDKVLTTFMEETKGKTALIVSHRLSLCKKVDRIIMLENGKIIEDGTHEKLMASNGKYSQMFKSQQKWY